MKRIIGININGKDEYFEVSRRYVAIEHKALYLSKYKISLKSLAALAYYILKVDEYENEFKASIISESTSDTIVINNVKYIFENGFISIENIGKNEFIPIIDILTLIQYFKFNLDEDTINKYYNKDWLNDNIVYYDSDNIIDIGDYFYIIFNGNITEEEE